MPAYSKEQSRIKLVVYIPTDSSDVSKVYYNFISKNRNPEEKIVAEMKVRILEQKLKGFFRKALFFNNETKCLIEDVNGKINNLTYDNLKSKVRMVVYLKDIVNAKGDTCYTKYSPIDIEDIMECVRYMTAIFLESVYNNKFRTAIFYRNDNNTEITKIYGNQYATN